MTTQNKLQKINSNIFLSFGPVSVLPQHAHIWVVDFQTHNRGHRNTRLCTSNVFNVLLYNPCLWVLPVSVERSSSSPSLTPSPSLSTSYVALALARFILSCYHHLLETHDSGIRTVSLQRSRIGHVSVYCATYSAYSVHMIPSPQNPLPPLLSLLVGTNSSHITVALAASL